MRKLFEVPTYNFAVVLYGCETRSLTLREESRLRVFANRGLRRIFVPKRDEVTGELRKLRNEELNDLYCSSNIVRVNKSKMRWAGHVARMGEGSDAYRGLVGRPQGKDDLEDLVLNGMDLQVTGRDFHVETEESHEIFNSISGLGAEK